MTVRLVSGPAVVQIATAAGFDGIYVDLEHPHFRLQRRAAKA